MTYDEEFKKEAVHGLRCIEQKGYYISPTGNRVETVRHYISRLGISSSTLYRWDASTFDMDLDPDRFAVMKEDLEDDFEDDFESDDSFDGELEAIVSLGKGNDFLSREIPKAEPEAKPMHIKITNTFLMSFLEGLGYSSTETRVPQAQLYLKLGLEFIKRSGLVESKAIEEMRL
jgi:hypothetical protein